MMKTRLLLLLGLFPWVICATEISATLKPSDGATSTEQPAATTEKPAAAAPEESQKVEQPKVALPKVELPKAENPNGPIFVAPLKGEVSPAQFFFLRRALKEAEREGASAFIIEIDTFGGRVDSAMDEMDALTHSRIPTYAFINPKAISAGALVSLATRHIYMHPDGVIGAAAVVSGGGEDLQQTMRDKASSMVSAKARGAAARNGHNPDVAEAFIVKEAEVHVNGEVVDSKEKLLSLSAAEATKEYGGKPLLSVGMVDSVEQLIQKAGLTGAVRNVAPTGFEQFAFWITMLAPLLLIGGIVGAYIEIKSPGFGVPGIISAACFFLYFTGHFFAGLAGWEVVVIFAIGLALVLGELIIHPGTMVPGMIGVLMMLGSLVWAMVDHWPGSPIIPTGDQLERPMLNLVTALLGSLLLMLLLAKYLPKTSLYHRLVLSTAVGEGRDITIPAVNLTVKAGDLGVATTTLRPAGKADFASGPHDVVTAGDYIEIGTRVRVIASDGMRVVVEAEAV